MAIRPNKYNDPALGQVMESIAGMFAPPDSGELVNYAQAAGLRQKQGIIEQLKSDPRYKGADAGVLADLFDPTSSWAAQDQNTTTKRYEIDTTAATSRDNNVRDNQRQFVTSAFGTVAQDAIRPAVPASVSGIFGVNEALPQVNGNRSPLSETQFKAGELERLLDAGTITDADIARDFKSGVNVEEVIGPDGKPMYVSRDAAIGMTPAPRTPTTSVTVGAGEKAWDVESAKLFAKRYDDLSGQANVAQDMLGLLSAAENALASGVYTGLGGDQLLDLQRLGTALGVDNADQVAGGELIRAIQNRMALLMRNPESGMGMPGAVSDRDITFLKAAQPGLGRSEEGNRQLIGMLAAMERRKIEVANLADAYVQENGRLDAGFNQTVREYAKANPLFPDPATAGANPGGASVDASGVYAVNPTTGERVVYRDGRWQPAE